MAALILTLSLSLTLLIVAQIGIAPGLQLTARILQRVLLGAPGANPLAPCPARRWPDHLQPPPGVRAVRQSPAPSVAWAGVRSTRPPKTPDCMVGRSPDSSPLSASVLLMPLLPDPPRS